MNLPVIFRFALLLFCSSVSSVFAQPTTFKLSGHLYSADTHESIPGASLSILGTSKGARSNSKGAYSLTLEANKEYRIRVSSLGYKPDTIRIRLLASQLLDITLTIAPLQSNDVIVTADASRREARRIMHQAIEAKSKWHNEINNYTCDVYSRINLQKLETLDTTLLTVFETFANGFYEKSKGYTERIIARKQTANIPPAINRISLLGVSNFYDDRIVLPEYSIISPLATDAFDRYDYDLLGTRQINGATAYEISVEPRGVVAPAFEGRVWIDMSDYSLVYLQLHPNGALKFPFVTKAELDQSYVEVENKYHLPAQTHVIMNAELQLPFTPKFSAELTGLSQNYVVNTTIPDSIFSAKRRDVDSSADKIDGATWLSLRGVPLTAQEENAYSRIDTIMKYVKPPAPDSSLLHFSFSPIISYDRVQATRLGLSVGVGIFQIAPIDVGIAAGYSFGDKQFRYTLSIDAPLLWKYQEELSTTATVTSSGDIFFNQVRKRIDIFTGKFSYFDDISRLGAAYGTLANSAMAFVFKRDYPDYMGVRGIKAGLNYLFSESGKVNLSFISHDERSLAKTTDRSLFFPSDTFRHNPTISDGKYHAFLFTAQYDLSSEDLTFAPEVLITSSSKSIGSSFDFTSISLTALCGARLAGLGPTKLQLAYNRKLSGAIPDQHLFIFDETRNFFFAIQNVFHTMNLREYQGDETYSAMLEQNFYDLPTRLLGLNLHPLDLHWFGFMNIAHSLLTEESKSILRNPVTVTGAIPFLETGFGIGNILNVLRIDAAWRVTHRKTGQNFAVTLDLGLHF